MKNATFPRWAAPFVGAGAGAFICLKAVSLEGQDPSWEWLLAGAAIGTLAGGLIWLADPPTPEPPVDSFSHSGLAGFERFPQSPQSSGTLIGRVLALLSILLFMMPIVGLGLGLAACVTNRRAVGWPRVISRIAFFLSLMLTLAFLAILALAAFLEQPA